MRLPERRRCLTGDRRRLELTVCERFLQGVDDRSVDREDYQVKLGIGFEQGIEPFYYRRHFEQAELAPQTRVVESTRQISTTGCHLPKCCHRFLVLRRDALLRQYHRRIAPRRQVFQHRSLKATYHDRF